MRLHHHREILVDVPVDFICFMLSMPLIMDCAIGSAGLAVVGACALTRPTDVDSSPSSASRIAHLVKRFPTVFFMTSSLMRLGYGDIEMRPRLASKAAFKLPLMNDISSRKGPPLEENESLRSIDQRLAINVRNASRLSRAACSPSLIKSSRSERLS